MRFDLRRTIIFILIWMLISALFKWIAALIGVGMVGYIFLIVVALLVALNYRRIKSFFKRSFKRRSIKRIRTESYESHQAHDSFEGLEL